MTIYKRVIALSDSPRIDRFMKQPQAVGFEIFDAVDGRKGEGFDRFDQEAFELRYGRSPLPGEVGCAVSHATLVEGFARDGREGDWLIVAEDDAVLSKNFVTIADEICRRCVQHDVIVLADVYGVADFQRVGGFSEWCTQMSFCVQHVVAPHGGRAYRIGHFAGVIWGAGLYGISHRGAQRFATVLDFFGKVSWLADDYVFLSRNAGLDIARIRPNLASFVGESSIREESRVGNEYYPVYHSTLDYVRARIALRTRAKMFRNSVAVTLRDIADLLEKPLS